MVTRAKLQLEEVEDEQSSATMTGAELKPILEALIYVAEEPITEATLVTLLGKEHQEAVREGLRLLLEPLYERLGEAAVPLPHWKLLLLSPIGNPLRCLRSRRCAASTP